MAAGDRLLLDTHVWKMRLDGDQFAPRALSRIEKAARIGTLYVAAVTGALPEANFNPRAE